MDSVYYFFIFLVLTLFASCQNPKLPKEKLSQFKLELQYEFNEEELQLNLKNTVHCPVRVWVQPKDERLKAFFNEINPILLYPLQDTTYQYPFERVDEEEIGFATRLGDINAEINPTKVELPFPKGKQYDLVQGYNSTPTHNTDWSRYALDFGLPIGDTICAATSGFVVGIIEDYQCGGARREWKDYGNYITIYHPDSGLYTQYAHLKHKGSLVQMGDKIEVGQIIGISGMTGQTNIEHLHFNCLKPIHSEDGLISIPIDSIGPYKVSEIKRYDALKH